MRIIIIIFSFFFIFSSRVYGQFAPAAEKAGSTALRYDSACFVAWASGCKIKRGLRDASRPDSGYANVGDSLSATGVAFQKGVLSLGDGGSATLTFKNPIMNGTGWDFAVFENTFLDTFLELAFVEVSTDGKKFVRFLSESRTDTTKQTGPFGYTHPEKVNNLAGKYIGGYGAPFDLGELKDSAGIDVNNIRFVRIVDVVGSMNPLYAKRDSKNRKINDPWPTLFPSSGFDLDAVGVIHENTSAMVDKFTTIPSIKIWPNPVNGNSIHIQSDEQCYLKLYDYMGREIVSFNVQKGLNLVPISIPTGMYYLHTDKGSKGFDKLIILN